MHLGHRSGSVSQIEEVAEVNVHDVCLEETSFKDISVMTILVDRGPDSFLTCQ